ncbi:hypothetical protein [Fibrella aquatilis]|uniref:Uncharacterized protein n=1 Tax=Fibrella aquatilis TaxID=2817059 RepID=A0A939K1Z0_9BACT|nr:hypothetical protein [Fibrella aquatilis]MBO0932755.1 hypothetical protein [Fibrella aquatilis]
MKKPLIEPDFIGGQGPLTKEEEQALSRYFASKKQRLIRKASTGRIVSPKRHPA